MEMVIVKPSHLRIGNYVLVDLFSERPGEPRRVSAQDIAAIDKYRSRLDGVPLDEGWLTRMGFEFIEADGGYADKNHYIVLKNGDWTFMPFCTNDVDCYTSIFYVHQLQNITFALTGEELKIKYDESK